MRRRILAGLVPLVTAVLAIGCGGTSGGEGEAAGDRSLTLVAYSTPRAVYEQLIPKFQATVTSGRR